MLADVSHFSMVGFAMEAADRAAFTRRAAEYANNCTSYSLDRDHRICVVRDESGGELWFGLRTEAAGASMESMDPAFVGEGRTRLDLVGEVPGAENAPFEIRASAKFAGEPTPLIFDLVDARQAARLKTPATVDVSLSAFCFSPELFDSEKAYYRAQQKPEIRVTFAANHFIPSGMMFESVGGALPDGEARPLAYADFAGTVVKSGRRSNAIGKGRFWWALVKTYAGATIDVVMDPSTVKKDPIPGTVLVARCWLNGRIL
jgi:hypothetical protein